MPFGFNAVRGKVLTDGETISGRVYVLGISVQPIYSGQAPTATAVEAIVKLRNGLVDTGDVLIELPIKMQKGYPTGIGFDYAEHGGYVLFPDGLYTDFTFTTGATADMAFSVSYQV